MAGRPLRRARENWARNNGLKVSHGAFDDSYYVFDAWRTAVARAAGLNPDEPQGEGPLQNLLRHADHEGTIPYAEARPLAAALTQLYPTLSQHQYMRQVTSDFIEGLLEAARRREDLVFS